MAVCVMAIAVDSCCTEYLYTHTIESYSTQVNKDQSIVYKNSGTAIPETDIRGDQTRHFLHS